MGTQCCNVYRRIYIYIYIYIYIHIYLEFNKFTANTIVCVFAHPGCINNLFALLTHSTLHFQGKEI